MKSFLQDDIRKIKEATDDLMEAVSKYGAPLKDERAEFEREQNLIALDEEMNTRLSPEEEIEFNNSIR